MLGLQLMFVAGCQPAVSVSASEIALAERNCFMRGGMQSLVAGTIVVARRVYVLCGNGDVLPVEEAGS